MYNLININTGEYPVTMEQFKRRINKSFGAEIDPIPDGYAFVIPTKPPVCSEDQRVVEASPVDQQNGYWSQQWSVVDLSEAEKAERQEAKAAVDKRKQFIETRLDAISANLPDWDTVSNAIDNISNMEDARAFIKKLTEVVYLVVRNRAD